MNTLIPTTAIVCICMSMAACNTVPQKERMNGAPAVLGASLAIPALEARTADIGTPEERDMLLDVYDRSRIKLEKDPTDWDAWLRMSEAFITDARVSGRSADQAEALRILDHILLQPKVAKEVRGEALTLNATVELSQHRFAEALELGREALRIDPYRAFNYGVMVDAYTELGHYDSAVVMCDRMVAIRPDLRSYSRISYQREVHGDVPGAIEAMDLALKAGLTGTEEASWCRVQIGGLYERSGDLDKAQAQYAQALLERRNYPFAMAALGRIAGKRKDHAEAERQLKAAIALMPDASFYEELARVSAARNRPEEHDEAVREAGLVLVGMTKGGDGHSHQVGLEMARFQLEFMKDLDNALTNAEHEFTHRKDNNDVNTVLAAIHYARGDMAKAAEHIALAQRTGSKDAYLMSLDGLVRSKQGEVVKGRELVAASFRIDPYQNHPFTAEALKLIGG
jgi:tetratricopeptide (TPR) repeat protein